MTESDGTNPDAVCAHCQNCMVETDLFEIEAPDGATYRVCKTCTELIEDGKSRCVRHNS